MSGAEPEYRLRKVPSIAAALNLILFSNRYCGCQSACPGRRGERIRVEYSGNMILPENRVVHCERSLRHAEIVASPDN